MDFQSTSTVTNAILRNRFVNFYTVTATTMSPGAVTEDNNNNSTANTTSAETIQGNKVKVFHLEVSRTDSSMVFIISRLIRHL